MKIKKIELVFENCDGLVIPISQIIYFNLHEIKEQFSSLSHSIEKYKIARGFEIFVNKDFKGKTDFDIDGIERIKQFQDITQIIVHYDKKGKKQEHYTINWKSSNTTNNPDQKVVYSLDGHVGTYFFATKTKKHQDLLAIDSLAKIRLES